MISIQATAISARPLFKGAVLSTASVVAMLVAGAANAQDSAQAGQTAQAPQVEEVVVTGTRIVRDGYEAPTPVTVVGVEQLQSGGTANIADMVNTLPAFSGSTVPSATNAALSAGTSGIQALNLRNLGPQRTLVLLDGQRSVGINTTQLVDVNLIPQALVSRVDVVTGGASAQYGSDALAGVVNFVLDKNFTGVKGDISGGVTTYGDDRSWHVSLTAGTGFNNDRGHFLFNAEAGHEDGIPVNNRPWNLTGEQFIENPSYTPTNGQPERLLKTSGVGIDNGNIGGIITSGPLKGVAFGPGGAPYVFQYGTLTSDPDTWNSPQFLASQVRGTPSGGGLTSLETTQSFFTRASYDISDNVQVFLQLSWAHNFNTNWCCTNEDQDDMTIYAGNPFIPASVAAQMAALKLTSFNMGTQNQDMDPIEAHNDRRTARYVVGANGKADAFDTTWSWNAYYQKGASFQTASTSGVYTYTNYFNAIDAVRGPNGQVMCRSTLTSPKDGCVPYNPFGIGVNSQAAISYVEGGGTVPFRHEGFTQDVMSASVSGEPFSDWAGPVSIATGIEHRREHVHGIDDPISPTFDWWAGNYQVFTASDSVTEGFVETDIPLAKDAVWAKALDLSAAARFTGYSTSGFVTTWKVGATYQLIDDFKLRATRSRDIRAANLNELFSAGGGGSPGLINPFRNGETQLLPVSTVGNPNLQPEKADDTSFGVVMQPTFFPGFSASVDYWNLDISQAIGTLTAQQILDYCYAGNQQLCNAITFGANHLLVFMKNQPFNLVNQVARGIDFEASYHVKLDEVVNSWGGDVTARFLATNTLKNYQSNGVNKPTDSAGENSDITPGTPSWRWSGALTYSNDPLTVGLTLRGLSGGTYLNSNIVCTSGCPASTSTNRTVDNNHIPGAMYLDTSFAYKLMSIANGDSSDVEAYLNIRNITNKDPAIAAQGPGGYAYSLNSSNGTFYDVLGRVFRAGVRFKLGGAEPPHKAAAPAAMAAAPAPMAPPPPPVAAAAPPPPPPAIPQKFLVFFDFDKSNVRDDAHKIVEQAADYAKKNGKVVIYTTGHTDRAGSDAYNMALSERRAKAVEMELEKMGFTAKQITITAKGESDNLVPTADGVREPQNRRVEIVMDP